MSDKYQPSYVIDRGHIFICRVCTKRFGGPVYGEREIEVVSCEQCTGKKSSREATANGTNTGQYGPAATRFCEKKQYQY